MADQITEPPIIAMTKGEAIVSKMTSGTFWCVVLITLTACYLAIIEPSIRDAFFALAGGIIRDYFVKSNPVTFKSSDKPMEEVKP